MNDETLKVISQRRRALAREIKSFVDDFAEGETHAAFVAGIAVGLRIATRNEEWSASVDGEIEKGLKEISVEAN